MMTQNNKKIILHNLARYVECHDAECHYIACCDVTTSMQGNGTPHFKNVNNCLNTSIYSYLGTSGGQNSNLYLNVVHFFNTSVNKTSKSA